MQCTINVAYRDIAVRITGALRIDTLHAVSVNVRAPYATENQRLHSLSLVFSFDSALTDLWSLKCNVFVKDSVMFLFPLQLKFKILEVLTSASVELPSSSPMFLHEERPVRHVSQQTLML